MQLKQNSHTHTHTHSNTPTWLAHKSEHTRIFKVDEESQFAMQKRACFGDRGRKFSR